MKSFAFFLSLFFFFSCSDQIPTAKNKIDYAHLTYYPNSQKTDKKLTIDSIVIPLAAEDILSSMSGSFFCHQDTLFFADSQLASLLLFTADGHYIGNRLNKGKGPNEIQGIHTFTPTKNDKYIGLDESGNIYIFNTSWKKIKQFQIDWGSKRDIHEKYNHPDPNNKDIYEIEYASTSLKPLDEQYLIFPIITEHIKYNAYEHAEHFYENVYTLGILDLTNEKIVQMLCPRSPVYQNYTYIPNFKNVLFDVYRDSLIFSFEPDPLIYKINLKNSLIFSFGLPGIGMKTDYKETTSFGQADNNYFKDRQKFGYYSALKYIPETGILFRSYHKGNKIPADGLQVYQNTSLIGDYDVPQGFYVFGYIYPWYYASGKPDFDSDKFTIYKFKIE